MTTSGSPTSGASLSSCSLSRFCSGIPWSWSSRKNRSLPRMSPYSPATCAGEVPVPRLQRLGDLAAEAGAEADEALAVLGEVLAVDARLVVEAVDVGVGEQPAQVAIADEVGRQQDHVERLAVGARVAVRHRPPGDVGLDAHDRLDARLRRRLVERDRSVERAVVGHGERVEAVLDRRVDEVRDPSQPVEQAELRVGVEVDEVVRGDGRHGGSMVARRRPPGGLDSGSMTPIDLVAAGPSGSLAGTLHLPPAAPAAVVLMVPGSGPMDRDNEGYFPAIREALVARGIAVASFDKRGVGGSAGDWRDTGPAEQRADAAAALAVLRGRPELGHVPHRAVRAQPGRLGGARGRVVRSRRRPSWSRAPGRASRPRHRSGSRSARAAGREARRRRMSTRPSAPTTRS